MTWPRMWPVSAHLGSERMLLHGSSTRSVEISWAFSVSKAGCKEVSCLWVPKCFLYADRVGSSEQA